MRLGDSEPGKPFRLPSQPGLSKQVHVFKEGEMWAIKAALAADRPLLVRGEPGSGKSQFARAAAVALNRPFVYEVITASTECTDLLWRFDAVARLAAAQVQGTPRGRRSKPSSSDVTLDSLDERRFLTPGPVWRCLNWRSAEVHNRQFGTRAAKWEAPKDWKPTDGCVLLVDEIDKADTDVPNGLLEALGNGSFHVPYLEDRIMQEGASPLVILTTNEERDLPAAFLRRCLVLTLELDKDRELLIKWLETRGKAHFGTACSKAVRHEAAVMLYDDRTAAKAQGNPAPGQAEYLDLLRALVQLTKKITPSRKREEEQLKILKKIADFALKKTPPVAF